MLEVGGSTLVTPIHLVVVMCAYALGGMVWGLVMSALATRSRALIQPRVWRWLNAVSGLLLAGYGIQLLWSNFAPV